MSNALRLKASQPSDSGLSTPGSLFGSFFIGEIRMMAMCGLLNVSIKRLILTTLVLQCFHFWDFGPIQNAQAETNNSHPGVNSVNHKNKSSVPKDLQLFRMGYSSRFSTSGSPQAQGIGLAIMYPKAWSLMETHTPFVIGGFHKQSNDNFVRGCEVKIRKMPVEMALYGSEAIARILYAPTNLPDLVSTQSAFSHKGIYISGERKEYAGNPGAWIVFREEVQGLPGQKGKANVFLVQHMFPYSGSLITFTCATGSELHTKEAVEADFQEYLPLYNLMAESMVIGQN